MRPLERDVLKLLEGTMGRGKSWGAGPDEVSGTPAHERLATGSHKNAGAAGGHVEICSHLVGKFIGQSN